MTIGNFRPLHGATLALLIVASAVGRWTLPGAAAEPELTPVIVELFTSQGCSSCPPADAVLASLARNQPVPGVLIVPLSEHVDYWDRLGWRDPFSSPRFTTRQRDYADTLDVASVYTPMMVVDGRSELVGSQSVEAREAIVQAARTPKTPVRVDVTTTAGSLVVDVRATIGTPPAAGGPAETDVWLAITESGLTTDVMAGENMFRRLRHTGVVRHLERLATVVPSAPRTRPVEARLRLAPDWNRERLSAVVFLQARATLGITGAAAATIR